MKVKLRLFALYREHIGKNEVFLELPAEATVATLRQRVEEDFPEFKDHDPMIAVNGVYISPDHKLSEGDEIALLPPFSGGQPAQRIELTDKPISPEAVTSKVLKDSNGGVVTFLGTVRNHSEGQKVRYLEYEAYPEMALTKMAELVGEIRTKWGIDDVAITHRLGHLAIGEIAVVIAVASPHRQEAFEACLYDIDRLKEIVPIWKKEAFVGGERWVAGD